MCHGVPPALVGARRKRLRDAMWAGLIQQRSRLGGRRPTVNAGRRASVRFGLNPAGLHEAAALSNWLENVPSLLGTRGLRVARALCLRRH